MASGFGQKADFLIIVPCIEIDSSLLRNLARYCYLDLASRAVMVLLPDALAPEDEMRVRKAAPGLNVVIEATGPVSPPAKRNIGSRLADTPYLAFIDSDAYPDRAWLRNALEYLRVEGVGAVGGPNLTPPDSSLAERASGLILASKIGMGSLSVRYRRASGLREVEELPSCNLIVKREAFEAVGGFREDIWPGEDSLLCHDLKSIGYKVVYAPDVVVYHYRRPLFRPHLRQMWRYGFRRGQLVRMGISRSALYFAPSALVIAAALGAILSMVLDVARAAYAMSTVCYLVLCTMATASRNIKASALAAPGLALTHLTYGLGFMVGFLLSGKKE